MIDVDDILVFENEAGDVYKEFVCEIERSGIAAYDDGEEDEYFTDIRCANFNVGLDSLNEVDYVECLLYEGGEHHEYSIKEIWKRTDDDTYRRVWSR